MRRSGVEHHIAEYQLVYLLRGQLGAIQQGIHRMHRQILGVVVFERRSRPDKGRADAVHHRDPAVGTGGIHGAGGLGERFGGIGSSSTGISRADNRRLACRRIWTRRVEV